MKTNPPRSAGRAAAGHLGPVGGKRYIFANRVKVSLAVARRSTRTLGLKSHGWHHRPRQISTAQRRSSLPRKRTDAKDAMRKYTCFVISPIGDKDSDIRRLADDLYELLIEPALEKFSFSVTRADKISSISSITSDVIEHIQNADLCIIDITGHNPNVMYECGRRHETGKPYIMVAKEGEKLPFDITTIRTVFYDLNKPREILTTKGAIQDMVARMLQDGFGNNASGDSLASVVELLRRIERKVDALPAATGGQFVAAPATSANDLVKRLGLVDAFIYARSQNDTAALDVILPQLKRQYGGSKDFVTGALSSGAYRGSRYAFEEMERLLPLGEEFAEDEKLEALSCYVTGAFRLGEGQRAFDTVTRAYGDLTAAALPDSLTVEQRAVLLNQYQRLLYALDREREAIAVGSRVLELCPTATAYLYNQILNFNAIGDHESALPIVDRLFAQLLKLSLDDVDPDHLKIVVKAYAKAKQVEKFRDAAQLLGRRDQLVFSVVSESEEVRALLKQPGGATAA